MNTGMNTVANDEKLNKLFHSESLGDQRPSELYYKMKNLADSVVGGAVPTNVVFNRWVNKLPTNVALSGINIFYSFLIIIIGLYFWPLILSSPIPISSIAD